MTNPSTKSETFSLNPSPVSSRSMRTRGIWMVLCGATLWGVSGSAAQVLFQSYAMQPAWLVAFRMFMSGSLLVCGCFLRPTTRKNVMAIWRHRKDTMHLCMYAVLGLTCVQYSYFASIRYGNAATATLLQYLGPVLIVLFIAFQARRMPTRSETVSVILAVLGCFFLVTNGHWRGLTLSMPALLWGLLSAVGLAFYTLYPKRLIQTYGSLPVVGWAMCIGGVIVFATRPQWPVSPMHSLSLWLLVGFVVLFGTLIAFSLYLHSLKYLSPSETSLIGCAEPLSSAAIALLFLHVKLGGFGLLGGLCILATILLLSRSVPPAT
jgi:drug/metabolite transporter (DMT)-like permease